MFYLIVMLCFYEIFSFLYTTDMIVLVTCYVTLFALLLAVFKLYISMTSGVYKGNKSMKGKTVIITGCNSGNVCQFKIKL